MISTPPMLRGRAARTAPGLACQMLLWLCLGSALGFPPSLLAQEASPGGTDAGVADAGAEEVVLRNGMRLLLVQRPGAVSLAAGWVARVGSVNERPGATGLTHLLEHMMFKGSETIGVGDRAREQAALRDEERLQDQIQAAYRRQRERYRAGEIADPYAPETFPPELRELLGRFTAVVERGRAATNPGEYGRLYLEAGAQGLNALTLKDMTLFFVTLPAESVELWFWLESDRLSRPVFRDFYTERRVVEEERRQRVDSTPTGVFQEELSALFWQSHPYGWPAVGWPSDLAVLRRSQAEDHFRTYYRPANLTAALVGSFDRSQVIELAERYFGRLTAQVQEPEEIPDVPTLEPAPRAEKRLLARCACRPQVEARYHTVAFGHPDTAALEVLAGLLNGRTGRLYRSLVVERGVAFSAYSQQSAMRWAGSFSFHGEAKGEAGAEDLLAAWERELERLRGEPVSEAELARVANGIAAEAYRRLREPSALLLQLLMMDGFGDWRHVERWAEAARAVTAEEVRAVVRKYFRPENRAVALYARDAEASPPPGEAP